MIAISKYNKQHPLRVFEAFAGYGSQSLAFKYLKDKHPEFDFKVVGYSEIEPSAIQAYGLLHGRKDKMVPHPQRYGIHYQKIINQEQYENYNEERTGILSRICF